MMIGTMVPDLRQTFRSLRRAPWYSATVVGVIALGMALATTVFAVVDGVLFKPIGLPAADRLFTIWPGFKDLPTPPGHVSVSREEIEGWSAAAPDVAFTGFAAQPWSGFGEGVNHDVAGGVRVQRNIFDVLGVRPLMGGFGDDDFRQRDLLWPIIVTYDLWQGRFQGDPDILGRTVEIDRALHIAFRVVGVMPRGFTFPSENTEVKFITPMVQGPPAVDPQPPNVRRFAEAIARMPAIVGVGILGLLAMSTARRVKEIGIRHALGATPPGIVRMLVREQLIPVVAGLAAGGLISIWAATLVEKYLYWITIHDPRVWVTAAALIAATAAIGALVPAIRERRRIDRDLPSRLQTGSGPSRNMSTFDRSSRCSCLLLKRFCVSPESHGMLTAT